MKVRKSGLLLLLFLTLSCFLEAQTVEAVSTDAEHVNFVLGNTLLIVGLIVCLGAVLAIGYVNRLLTESIKIQLLQEHGREVVEKVGITIKKESWWKRQYKKWTQAVPIEKEGDIMLDHNYDGIRELDNSLPPWWVAMFYITIAFGFVYIYYQHFSDYGLSQEEEYALQVEEAADAVKLYLASQANTVDESNVEMLADKEAIAVGASIFAANCAACHGQLGEGGVGPNLTDNYWINGGSIKDIFKTIKYGVPEKGMIAWQAQLRPADMHKISSYIMTLEGTNPPNAKEPQGELYEATEEVAKDSTSVEQLGMK